jgi:hypothetical protein
MPANRPNSGELLSRFEDIADWKPRWSKRGWTLQELVLSKMAYYAGPEVGIQMVFHGRLYQQTASSSKLRCREIGRIGAEASGSSLYGREWLADPRHGLRNVVLAIIGPDSLLFPPRSWANPFSVARSTTVLEGCSGAKVRN